MIRMCDAAHAYLGGKRKLLARIFRLPHLLLCVRYLLSPRPGLLPQREVQEHEDGAPTSLTFVVDEAEPTTSSWGALWRRWKARTVVVEGSR